MKLTAIGSGYYRVFKDGLEFSKHTSEREALESAFNLEAQTPGAVVTYKHDYEVKVESQVVTPPPPTPTPPPTSFQLYSPDSFWNKKLSSEPIHANSAGFVPEVWENVKVAGCVINTTNYGKPIYFVGNDTPKVPVKLLQDIGGVIDKEIQAGVPIPQNVVIANGTDGHLCIINKDSDIEYDFYRLKFVNGAWEAKTCGIIHGVSTSDGTLQRLSVWNSATATHLPLAGGVIMLKELEAGVIPHAIAVALQRPAAGYQNFVWPAKSTDGYYTGPNAIKEGQRFRFPADIAIDPLWTPITKMLVTAIRDYGMVVIDKSGSVSFYAEDPRVHGKDGSVLTPYYGGKAGYKIFGDKNNLNPEFPWSKLEALA